MTLEVSVVVPTCRRHDLLQRCMAAILAQDLSHDQFELIIADDAADPATRSLVESIAREADVAVRYIPVAGNHGPAAARNSGWHTAHADVIAFTDDDCQPASRWLSNGLAAIRADADAVTGAIVMPLPVRPTDYERDAAGLATSEFATANCFCRRASLELVHGFDERFTSAWREDSDLQFSLLEHNQRIIRCDDAIVVHPIRPAPWGISLRQQKKTQFNALLYKKHPQLYRQRLAAFPRDYYAIVALLGVTALGMTVLSQRTLLLSGITWAAMTTAFCIRRLQSTSRSLSHVCEMIVTSILIPPLSFYWYVRGMWQFRVFYT